MRQLSSQQSRDIFRQLADVPGGSGVKTIIENHDAWVHSDEVQSAITAAMRAAAQRRPREEALDRRIAAQRRSLDSLVTRLPVRILHAG